MDFYLAGHLNAGGGDYALIEYNPSNTAEAAARILGINLVSAFKPIIHEYKIHPFAKGERGYICLAGVKCPAVLLEPCFIDNPKEAEGLQGDWAEKIGKVVSDSIQELIRCGVLNIPK
jgi:N-acetylmuramoyl-L-alanine amidase